MIVDADDILQIMPLAKKLAWTFERPLNDAMEEFAISTPERAAAFLAQLAHESGQLQYVREIWGPTKQQSKYERNFAAAWPPTQEDQTNNVAHALGNTQKGDGAVFKGHGLIQITGRANHRKCSRALYGDDRLLTAPELLEEPDEAARSAGWFWSSRNLNGLADKGEFRAITKKINGGLIGIQEREEYYRRAKVALGIG